ncbi:MAG TPA: hypothetical protein VI911_05930 [Patescibacteria group bacterium]|nr:hypothetical protein [Patescibacteria group bacterium]
MKIQELRIGNIVELLIAGGGKFPNEIRPIKASEFYALSEHPGWAIPVPLTELWLEKFGFKSIGLNGQVFEHKEGIGWEGDDRFVIETDCKLFYPKFNFDDCCWTEFKYVHQLQNLYFALTGNELEMES